MDNELVSNSSISLDSLEIESKGKSLRKNVSEEHVDTILVPLYEKDVLIKVPKRKQTHKNCNENIRNKKDDLSEPQNYLVNKDYKKAKKTSYLEMFRKQFTPNINEDHNKKISNEIRSISPEFGDTERESIGCESCDPENDFYNTEAYNEIYYDKILKSELEQFLEQSFEDVLRFGDDFTKCEDDINCNNLRSVSEVSQPRRRTKNKAVPLMQNIRLGGLGPDMENIKPRLERARSLQRYSEKVRMENRLKIYKKGVENEKIEREASATRRDHIQKQSKEQAFNKKKSSYLINKVQTEKPSLIKKICNPNSKSAEKLRKKDDPVKEKNKVKNEKVKRKNDGKTQEIRKSEKSAREDFTERYVSRSFRVKSGGQNREVNNAMIENNNQSPLQISFLVNVGGVRPTSALRSLEEKHRMYQEKVKAYCADFKNI